MGAAERRKEILRVLCLRKYDTISNLAEEFGVSKRTIQRDIVELSITEPIYTQSGKYIGGVYIMENYSMDKSYLTDSEYELLHKVLTFAKTKSVCELEDKEIVILENYISKHKKPKIERKNNDESKRKKAI